MSFKIFNMWQKKFVYCEFDRLNIQQQKDCHNANKKLYMSQKICIYIKVPSTDFNSTQAWY